MALSLLSACAEPGARPDGGNAASPMIAVSLPPATDTLPCTKATTAPGRSATPADVATPRSEGALPRPSNEYLDEAYREEMLRRQMEANDAYLNRRPLPETALPGAIRCAIRAEDALRPLHERKVYDKRAVEKALTAAGLPESYVRAPGSRDRMPHDGVIIGNWTGQACIVGYLSREYGAHIEYGSTTADGGCLPAGD
ncbi:hypothetical protein MB27_29020 [Actinoplanes utahensis]|uniref:Uncharacterized protein n=1 Tax=Actinoplanes utahensis TaxID=1869 RepID=A0A0A6UG21_ACTUT|nr:hypothetical protein MB27_29020 [Actinoplanes utahensis]GIF31018.1 hypothetical protein Aut01nite_40040 [Actinoplanes utahensis]